MTKLAGGQIEIVKVLLKDNKRGLRITFNNNVETRQIYRIRRSGIYMHKATNWK